MPLVFSIICVEQVKCKVFLTHYSLREGKYQLFSRCLSGVGKGHLSILDLMEWDTTCVFVIPLSCRSKYVVPVCCYPSSVLGAGRFQFICIQSSLPMILMELVYCSIVVSDVRKRTVFPLQSCRRLGQR